MEFAFTAVTYWIDAFIELSTTALVLSSDLSQTAQNR